MYIRVLRLATQSHWIAMLSFPQGPTTDAYVFATGALGGSVCIGVGWRAAATPNIFFTNRIQRALLLVLLLAGTKSQSSRIFVDKLAACSDRPWLKSPARRHPAHCTQASRRPRFPPPPSLMPAAAPPHDVCRAAAALASHEAKMPCGPSCSSPPPSPSPPRGGASSRLGGLAGSS